MSLTAMPTSMAGHEDSRAHATIDQERTKAYEQQAADAREYAIMLEAEYRHLRADGRESHPFGKHRRVEGVLL